MTMHVDRRTLIFVPTYNEAGNVELLYRDIKALDLDADILFLDDNSPDGTGTLIDGLAATDSRVHAIHRSGKLGIGSAHLAGIAWAYRHGYQLLVTMDCDFTHSPNLIPAFIEHSNHSDVVIGSRYLRKGSLRHWNLLRKALTHAGHFLTNLLLDMPHDATGAFRVYRLDRIPAGTFSLVLSLSYSFFFESLYVLQLNGHSIHEVPIDLPARTYGHSKMAFRDALRSVMLLAYLWAKTIFDRKSLMYAEPFQKTESLQASQVEEDWDRYWNSQKDAGGLVYDLIAAAYRRYIIRPILNHFMVKHFVQNAQVLHAGCGSGQVDIDVAKRLDVSALDISASALSIYRKFNPRVSRLIHGSIFDIPLPPESLDGVYNLGVMEHFSESEIRDILNEFHRVVRPGGKIVLFWPPSFGLTVRVLAVVHWFANKVLHKNVKLHPDEITHVRSKKQVRDYLESAGFGLVDFYFGGRDLFTQAVVVGQKLAAGTVFNEAGDIAVTVAAGESMRHGQAGLRRASRTK